MAALSMLFLALLLNLVAVQYAHGVVRAALDEGVRRASPAPAGVDECHEGIGDVLSGLLAGSMGDGVVARCQVIGTQVIASAHAVFGGWLPLVPDMTIELEVRGVKELAE